MSLETYVDSHGDTYTLVHPAGISYFDQSAEIVTKANSSIAYVAGDLAVVNANTLAGETWRYGSADIPRGDLGLRVGILTADSGSGLPTMSIKRVPFIVMRASTGGTSPTASNTSKAGNITGGDHTSAGNITTYDNYDYFQHLPLFRMSQVSKPPGENWTLSQTIYGYVSLGITAYTNSLSTATANLTYWVQGICCLASIGGTVASYVHQATFFDATITMAPFGLSKSPSAKSIKATASGAAPTLLTPVFVSIDLLSISSIPSAICNIQLGSYCVGIDNSTSPPTYSYFDTYGMYEGGSMEAIDAAITDDLCLMTCVVSETVRHSYGGCTSSFTILGCKNNADGTKNLICAPTLSGRGNPVFPDMAYDPILPAPFDNLRIIWSETPGISNASMRHQGLFPALAARTNRSSAPYVGMIASNRYKPDRFSSLPSYSNNNGGPGSSCFYPLVRESRSTPYTWKEPVAGSVDNTWFTMLALINGISIRGAMFPAGTLYYNGTLGLSNYEWRWETYSPLTASWSGITSYVTGSGSALTWTATIVPPVSGINSEEVYLVRLATRLTFVSSVGGDPTRFSNDYKRLGAWPYDIVKLLPFSDAGGQWAGSAGWIWPNEPAGPSVAWSSEPTFSLVGNTLTLSTSIPVRTVSPDNKFSNLMAPNYNQGLDSDSPSMSITYDDGDSAFIPDMNVLNIAYSKGGGTPSAIKLRSLYVTWVWGSTASMLVYPSRSGSKKITVMLYYVGIIPSAYTNRGGAYDDGYGVTRIVKQTFTLP